MNFEKELQKMEREKRKLFRKLRIILKNEDELLKFIAKSDFSGFYKTVVDKYHYRSIEYNERLTLSDEYENVLEKIKNTIKLKEYLNKKSKTNTNGYKVGDILYSSWGYEQTNVDFYQIVYTSEKMLYLAPIGYKSKMEHYNYGTKEAIRDSFNLKKSVFKTLSKCPQYTKNSFVRALFRYENKAVYFSNDY